MQMHLFTFFFVLYDFLNFTLYFEEEQIKYLIFYWAGHKLQIQIEFN